MVTLKVTKYALTYQVIIGSKVVIVFSPLVRSVVLDAMLSRDTQARVPPAGTLLLMLNQFADRFELSPDTDNYLRSFVPASVAFGVVSKLISPTDSWHQGQDDVNALVTSTARGLCSGPAPVEGLSLASVIFTRGSKSSYIEKLCLTSSAVQAMQLVDDFCSKFSVEVAGEKELKFGIPLNSMILLVSELIFDHSFLSCPRREIYLAGRARRIRHELGIDSQTDPILSLVPVNRSDLAGDSVSSTPSAPVEAFRVMTPVSFQPNFPLYMKSVLKHTGPPLVLALSVSEIESVIIRWQKQFPRQNATCYLDKFPIDCVLRGIRAFPTSIKQVDWFIRESMKAKGRLKLSSVSVLTNKIIDVYEEHHLSDATRDKLLNTISATYAHLIINRLVDKKDSRALSKGGKWISCGRLLMFETHKREIVTDEDGIHGPLNELTAVFETFDI